MLDKEAKPGKAPAPRKKVKLSAEEKAELKARRQAEVDAHHAKWAAEAAARKARREFCIQERKRVEPRLKKAKRDCTSAYRKLEKMRLLVEQAEKDFDAVVVDLARETPLTAREFFDILYQCVPDFVDHDRIPMSLFKNRG